MKTTKAYVDEIWEEEQLREDYVHSIYQQVRERELYQEIIKEAVLKVGPKRKRKRTIFTKIPKLYGKTLQSNTTTVRTDSGGTNGYQPDLPF